MISWMLRSVLAGVVVALATWLVGLAAQWLGRPRRWIWAGGLALAWLLPFVGLLLPARVLPAPSAGGLSPADLATLLASAPAAAASSPGRGVPPWLPGVLWAVASAALLAAEAYALVRLRRARREWHPGRLHGTDVLIAARVGPAVVGLRKPCVVVPPWVAAAPERERAMVLAHERAHVEAGDPRLLAVASLLTALLPWSPALWWLQFRLRHAVETDCDARVLAGGCDVAEYGRVLLDAASRPSLPLARVALAERNHMLDRRIRAMTAKLPQRPVARVTGLILGAAALMVAACELSSPPAGQTTSPTATKSSPVAAGPVDGQPVEHMKVSLPAGKEPAYFVDGKPVTAAQAKAIDPEKIARVDVQKDPATGSGVIRITTGQPGVSRAKMPAPEGAVAVGYGTARVPVHAAPGQAYADGYAAGRAIAAPPPEGLKVRSIIESPRGYVLLVDGREVPSQSMRQLDPRNIKSIYVTKVDKYNANIPPTVPDTIKVLLK